MKQEINPRLLTELAALARRYHPEEFAGLARALEDGRLLSQLIEVVRQMEECSRQTHRKPESKKTQSPRSNRDVLLKMFDSLKETDPEKFDLLKEFMHSLTSGELLPTPGQVRAFAEEWGIPDMPPKASRTAICTKLLRFLSSKPAAEIRIAMEQARTRSTVSGGATLKDWADIIMRPRSASR